MAVHERARHHVEHLVGDHEAADLLGQAIDPHEARHLVDAEALVEEIALALAQVRLTSRSR
jgi:hypothetical protein